MPAKIELLTTLEVVALHAAALKQSGDPPSDLVRRDGLEGAIYHVSALAWYENAGLARLAVDLLMGIALAHAWVDGNKRTASFAMYVFLRINGVRIDSRLNMDFARQFVSVVAMLPEDRAKGRQELEQTVQFWIDAS